VTEEGTPADIRILGGEPDAQELAAITAVLTAALDELAGEQRRQGDSAPSAWDRSRRAVRRPLMRGDWRSFGG
jgi:hypothetical protein